MKKRKSMKSMKSMMFTVSASVMSLLLAACGAATSPAVTPAAFESPLVASPTTEGITTLPTPNPAMTSPIQPAQPAQPSESSTIPPRTLVTVDPALLITPELTPAAAPLSTGATLTPSMVAQNPAVGVTRDALAKQLQLEASSVTVVSVEEVQWPDGCLGVRMPDVLCLQVIVPGYRIALEANGARYVYHTDQTGQQIVLAEPRPRP